MFVFQCAGILQTKDVLYVFRAFEYLLAGLAFCLFYAGQGRGVDRDSCDGSDAACDPFRLVITSLPHSLRMERNRQKEIDGVEQSGLPIGGCRRASQFVSELFISMIFQGMDQLLSASSFPEVEQSGSGNKRDFFLKKPADRISLHICKMRIGQMVRATQTNMLFPFHQRRLAKQAEAGIEKVQEVIQNRLHSHSR